MAVTDVERDSAGDWVDASCPECGAGPGELCCEDALEDDDETETADEDDDADDLDGEPSDDDED